MLHKQKDLEFLKLRERGTEEQKQRNMDRKRDTNCRRDMIKRRDRDEESEYKTKNRAIKKIK